MLKLPFWGRGKSEPDDNKLNQRHAGEIIKLACESRKSVEVILEGERDFYGSFFVGCREDEPSFYLDLLIPKSRNDLLKPGEVASVDFSMHNIKYRLSAPFIGVERWQGYDALRFAAPTYFKSVQNRGAFRVEPGLSKPVEINVTGTDFTERTDALDISVSGARFRLSRFTRDAGLSLDIKLPTEEKDISGLRFEVIEVRRIDAPNRKRLPSYVVRGRFIDIASPASALISRYIAARQRENNAVFD